MVMTPKKMGGSAGKAMLQSLMYLPSQRIEITDLVLQCFRPVYKKGRKKELVHTDTGDVVNPLKSRPQKHLEKLQTGDERW